MFYEEFKRVCKEKGTSPTAVVVKLGMSRSFVTQWKHGLSPRLDTVFEIAKHLGVPVTELVREEGA